METIKGNKYGRVRANTPDEQNQKIDLKVEEILEKYRHLSADEISCRLSELKKEWGIEKTLEVNALSPALTGIFLETFSPTSVWITGPGRI